jgi:hypothetical protein
METQGFFNLSALTRSAPALGPLVDPLLSVTQRAVDGLVRAARMGENMVVFAKRLP